MSIVLERLVKRYGSHAVVDQLSLAIGDGEFFVLLGPSGSGKSTVLRMIAGLVPSDAGRVLLHERDVTHERPQRRGVGFVFQHYALFGHMSVARNVEFALAIRRVPRAERSRRGEELLQLVGLAGLGARMPSQLSGGQQQRVALARALAREPAVLLLDEPFGSLDARIRTELRRTVRSIQRSLGVTTILVTHDQDEAFELADRIGIMHHGRLLEVGPPQDLYLRPQTEFVATFLGAANLMVGQADEHGVRLGDVQFPLATDVAPGAAPRPVQVLFRPEDVAVKDEPGALEWPLLGRGIVEDSEFAGSYERLRLRLPPLPGVRAIAPRVPFGAASLLVEATRSQHQARRFPLRPGDASWVGVRRVHALAHPGLGLTVFDDGTPAGSAALDLAGAIARRARARVTVVVSAAGEAERERRLARARERLGAPAGAVETRGLARLGPRALAHAVGALPGDLLLWPRPPDGMLEATASLLAATQSNVLLMSGETMRGELPASVLVAVAVGEPGKEDIEFTGRLVRHLGRPVTVLTVIDEEAGAPAKEQALAFLAAGVKTLALFGVEGQARVRSGDPCEEILAELAHGGHELLVVGASPVRGRAGALRDGLLGSLLAGAPGRSVLVVRTPEVTHGPRVP